MSLTELKAQAQQLSLTKENVAEFGDLRKKTTWELAIADFQSQVRPNPSDSASMLEPANEVTGVSEVFLDGKPENSYMDADNLVIANNQLVNTPISFGKTLDQLLSGKKIVTRRLWKDEYAHQFIKRFNEGRATYPAFDKDRRYGGKQVGIIRLTCAPYKERLGDMPKSDLKKEGFPELTQQEFISRFFDGDSDIEVWVIRFEFTPNTLIVTEPKPKSEIILTLFGPALKINDEHGERCFLRNEFVELDNKLVAQVTGVFTNNLVEIQLKTREIFSVIPGRLQHL